LVAAAVVAGFAPLLLAVVVGVLPAAVCGRALVVHHSPFSTAYGVELPSRSPKDLTPSVTNETEGSRYIRRSVRCSYPWWFI
jgi:hypothetical protein